MNYEVVEDERSTFIRRTDADGKVWVIPMVEGNSDYQRYLRWLENPNEEEGTQL